MLEPGGVVCAYMPTTPQVQQLVLALPAQGFLPIETFEVLRRGGTCQARMSDGTAFALFDVRRAEGLFWLTIGTPT